MKTFVIFLMCSLFCVLVFADPYDLSALKTDPKIKYLIENEILNWINNPVLLKAIKQANIQNKNRSLDKVKELDKKWRAVNGVDEFIKQLLTNEAALFLKNICEKSQDKYAEIFIMDFQGCNVAQTHKTSDYWQGDEDKFIKSFNNGKGAVFADKVEFDESTQEYLIQVSLPIIDTGTKKAIGAATIGVNVNKI